MELSPVHKNAAKVGNEDEQEQLISKETAAEPSERKGSIPSSVFSLVILCLGSGTLTFPFIFYANGLYLGFGLILFGAAVSVYTGWLIVLSAE